MPSLRIKNENHELSIPLLHVKSMFTSNEKVIEHFFSSIACNLMITSNKQRQEHNNLVTTWRPKLKGAHEHSQEPRVVLEPKCELNKNGQGSH